MNQQGLAHESKDVQQSSSWMVFPWLIRRTTSCMGVIAGAMMLISGAACA
jgi:hypothetical protein